MKHTDKGYFAEQLAMAWLIKQGYWVFKNIAPQGPVDCVAISHDGIKKLLVDVKVISKTRFGYTRSKILTARQKRMGVKILYVDIDKLECRFKNSWDEYKGKVKREKDGQLIKLPTSKI